MQEQREIDNFSRLASSWWDETGPLRTLHQLNPARLHYIRQNIETHLSTSHHPLRVLDIGCGGGLVSVPLARLGLHVTGLDASAAGIASAQQYARDHGYGIDFHCTTLEQFSASAPAKFDVILILELLEHVANPAQLISLAAHLLNPGGLLFFSTINRTANAFLGAVVAAEYILRWLPRGTHRWQQFIKPAEMVNWLEASHLKIQDLSGLRYDPVRHRWYIGSKLDVNYIGCAKNLLA